MDTSRVKAAGAAAAPNGTERPQWARFRELLRASGSGDETASAAQLAELEHEVTLLREENARLKVARAHGSNRPINERVRASFASREGDEDDDEDPWQVLTECMLLRESLLDACRELERGASELRTRLETLMADAEDAERLRGDLEGVT